MTLAPFTYWVIRPTTSRGSGEKKMGQADGRGNLEPPFLFPGSQVPAKVDGMGCSEGRDSPGRGEGNPRRVRGNSAWTQGGNQIILGPPTLNLTQMFPEEESEWGETGAKGTKKRFRPREASSERLLTYCRWFRFAEEVPPRGV